ncbi:MAG: 16S rRNA (uracil(1498)-N(3))-methyltransferase [Desulfovibrionaceae bacterium]|nr:16S rRNA (uracil(1498)-N(3))-methyltransferase [Desulfovibrionaceae bacterium]
MARLNTFFLPPDQWPASVGDVVTLAGAEARHMGTVLRTEAGRAVRLFDGTGRTGLFTVEDIAKNRARLVADSLDIHPAPVSGLTLAIGWCKSKRRDYLFEKTVELKGIGLIFWQAARSQGRVPDSPKDTWMDKCVQAAKQCGNPHLPVLGTLPGGADELIERAAGFDQCLLAWESEDISTPLAPSALSKGRTLVVIGPEGGFDRLEAEKLAGAGFAPVTLGDSILRWETAAAYCLSLGFYSGQETP